MHSTLVRVHDVGQICIEVEDADEGFLAGLMWGRFYFGDAVRWYPDLTAEELASAAADGFKLAEAA